jgi:hypothetical protein
MTNLAYNCSTNGGMPTTTTVRCRPSNVHCSFHPLHFDAAGGGGWKQCCLPTKFRLFQFHHFPCLFMVQDTKVPDLLLAHLCTLGCLPHFLAHCGGRLESAELCAASRMEKGEREELLFPSGSGVSSSICQVLTDFVAATFLALQSQQQQHKGAAAAGIEEEAPSRRDSASCCGQSDNGSSVRTTTTETLVSSSSGTHNQPMTNIGGAGGGGQQQKSSAER